MNEVPEQYQKLKAAFLQAADWRTAYDPSIWAGGLQGHCGAVAYTIQRIMLGEVIMGTVNGERHFWNRPGVGTFAGVEIDFTSEQFGGDGYFPKPEWKGKVMPNRKTVNPKFKKFHKKALDIYLKKDN